MTFTVAVDAMGGDLGPRAAFKGVIKALKAFGDLRIIFFVQDTEKSWLESQSSSSDHVDRLEIQYCDQVVEMDDKPSHAIRRKRNSTMAKAIDAVNQQADACLSSGNTGALMALGRSLLSTHYLFDRPAMATDMPNSNGTFLMLDLGANIQPSADQLYQFAVMGNAWRKAQGIASPRLGMLNVGKEEIKGTEEIRLASQQIQQDSNINYIGFLEGDDLYKDQCDVVVCDGFSGNIALKTSEGLVGFIEKNLADSIKGQLLGRLLYPLIKKGILHFQSRLNPVMNSGATLLGLNGLIVKTHGNSDEDAYFHSIQYTLTQLRSGAVQSFAQILDEIEQ